MVLLRVALCAPLIFFLSTQGRCQTIDVARLDTFLMRIAANNMGMGSLAISRNGAIVYQRAFGRAGDDSRPNDISTRFQIGSISKTFTTVVVLKLVEAKKLSLDNSLSNFLPQLPNAANITIRDLLYHRSGLHDYTVDTDFQSWLDKRTSQRQLLELIMSKGADFTPGTRASYSNSNYLVLSYVIEKVTGSPYQKVVRDFVISKLKLTNTGYGRSGNESTSYKYNAGEWVRETETNLDIHSGAGALVSTPSDLVHFAEALFSGTLIGLDKVEEMKLLLDGYGMGLFPFRFRDKSGFGHGGRIDGFSSSLQYYPKEGIAIAYCTNGIVFPKNDILDGVLHAVFGEPYEMPDFKHPKIDTEQLRPFSGEYTSAMPPISLTCRIADGSLVVDTQGQSFALEPIGGKKFCNAKYGFFFEFEQGQLVLKEGDNVYNLKKK